MALLPGLLSVLKELTRAVGVGSRQLHSRLQVYLTSLQVLLHRFTFIWKRVLHTTIAKAPMTSSE
jgi:hypothetical protein